MALTDEQELSRGWERSSWRERASRGRGGGVERYGVAGTRDGGRRPARDSPETGEQDVGQRADAEQSRHGTTPATDRAAAADLSEQGHDGLDRVLLAHRPEALHR